MTVGTGDLGLYKSDHVRKPHKNWRCVLPSLGMLALLLLGTILVAVSAKRATIKKIDNSMQSEKIVWSTESTRFAHVNPAPFKINQILGAETPPETFKTMNNKPTPFTTKKQMTNSHNHEYHFPRSIRDIIQGVASTNHNVDDEELFKEKEEFAEQNITGNGFRMQDPFHNFKPNTPGDVNLLATASVRFAQPVWQSFSSIGAQKPSFGQKLYQYVKPPLNRNQEKNELKPLAITLNIFGDHPLKNFAKRLIPVNIRETRQNRQKNGMLHESENVTINLKVVPEVKHHGTAF